MNLSYFEEKQAMHDGHRERMRKKLISAESKTFYEHELLEILLYATCARGDTNPLAHELINEFGSFSAVFDASYDDLLKVKGVGVQTATLIKTIPLVAAEYLKDKSSLEGNYISGDEDAFNYVLPYYISLTEEMTSALFLSNSGKVLGYEKIGGGTVSVSEIPVRKLISFSLKYNAAQVILFHNHPSGVALPSNNDVTTTKSIIDTLKSIDVKLADHIIIAGNDYVSMSCSSEFSFLFN